MGVDQQFEDEAIAFPKSLPKHSSTAVTQNWDDSGDDDSRAPKAVHERSNLRERSQTQLNPYQADKFQYERAKAGKPKLEFGSDQTPTSTRVKRMKTTSASTINNSKRQRTAQGSESRTITPSSTPQELSGEDKYHQTKLYTRLQSDPGQPSEVICLEDGLTVDALFAEVRQAWRLDEEADVKLAVFFSWLPEMERLVSIRPNRPRSLDHMLEVVRRAPCWEDEAAQCAIHADVITA